SVGPPAFTPFVVPLALILVLLAGVGPLISWRRATVANLRRHFVFPVAFGVLVTILVLALTGAGRRPLAVAMFGLGAFVIGTVVQEFFRGTAARRAITGDPWPLALLGLVRRNRRRYGGYIAHFGLAVLLIGVAASSSFQQSVRATLRPGESATVGGYRFHYVHPTATATPERVSFGAVIDVTRSGSHVTRLHTMQSFYPSSNAADGYIGRFFDSGNADSTIGLDAGPLRDIWTVAAANLTPLEGLITEGDRRFAALVNSLIKQHPQITNGELNAELDRLNFWTYRDEAVQGIVGQYLKHPYPVQFLLIVSPLVSWLWAGAMIIAIGGLISLVPAAPFTRRRRGSGGTGAPTSAIPEPAAPVAVRELA
ncbi:MAG: heme lyase CcmF/NrfE family subunit, partial [Conexibacteraceae bacterium]|nr:heme lyase CcmF/NrfE family subunit [Conexibacteraceae bacterium]